MVNNADIDAAIAGREAQVVKLRRELEIAEAELRGMKTVRDQFLGRAVPSAVEPVRVRTRPTYTGGRQPGSISKIWRSIYSDLYHGFDKGWFSESQLIPVAFKHGVELRPKDARERLQAHSQHEIVEESPVSPAHWRVIEAAARKFGFADAPLKGENVTTERTEPNGDDIPF